MADYQLSVDIIGAKELKDAITSTSKIAINALLFAINKTAIDLERKAREKAPHRHGGLWNSIHAQSAKVTAANIEAHVGTNLKYAVYQEKGTRPHIVQIRNKKVLYSKETGKFYGIRVNIPAMAGKFYMKKAKDEIRPEMTNNMANAMQKIVSHLATRPAGL